MSRREKNKALLMVNQPLQNIEKIESTTKTIIRGGENPSKSVISKTVIKRGGESKYPIAKLSHRSSSTDNTKIDTIKKKEKFSYAERVKEKKNYVYYVSGIGYVTKEEKIEKKVPPKPVEIKEREVHSIVNKKKERKGELVDNFEYHETKAISNKNKESIVFHGRLGDPFYQTIDRTKYSSLTEKAKKYKVSTDAIKPVNKRIETDFSTYKTQTENRKIIDTSKYQKKTTPVVKDTQINKYTRGNKINTDAYKRTEKTKVVTTTNTRVATDYSRKPKIQCEQKQITCKTKYENKYQRPIIKEEKIVQQPLQKVEEQMIEESNICPIHGKIGIAKQEEEEEQVNQNMEQQEYIKEQINEGKENEVLCDTCKLPDNYQFHESRIMTTKVCQTEGGRIEKSQKVNEQAQMAQEQETGENMTNIYMATQVTPVYTEQINQQGGYYEEICEACGRPLYVGEEVVENTNECQKEVTYKTCPIHGTVVEGQ